jgi:hypothetical protein
MLKTSTQESDEVLHQGHSSKPFFLWRRLVELLFKGCKSYLGFIKYKKKDR